MPIDIGPNLAKVIDSVATVLMIIAMFWFLFRSR